MKMRWLLPAAAVALAIFALSIPSPILSTKGFAQNTGQQTPTTKKSKTDTPKGPLYKSPGARAKCRMGNCGAVDPGRLICDGELPR
jgi:hypothetical protein